MTTKGSVKNTRLPPAPTDFCPANLAAQAATFINGTITDVISLQNGTTYNETVYDVTSAYITTTETMASTGYPEP